MLRKWLRDEEGQALAEYGLLVAVIAVAVIAVLFIFRDRLARAFKTASDQIGNQTINSANPN